MADTSGSDTVPKARPKMGCGTFIAICIVAFVLLGIGLNQAAGYYFENCTDQDVLDCFLHPPAEAEHTGVTAKGTYTYGDYSAVLTLYIPLEGGAVTGDVSGTCTGTVKGTFDGRDNGIITGSMAGYCDPFFIKIPAEGSFAGTVGKAAKKVPLRISGSGGGFSKEDGMTLDF